LIFRKPANLLSADDGLKFGWPLNIRYAYIICVQ
jgi:hypothetical protein